MRSCSLLLAPPVDYNMATVDWRRKTFALIDTGGINVESLTKSIEALLPTRRNAKQLREAEGIEKEIVTQTKAAFRKSGFNFNGSWWENWHDARR